MENKNNLKIKNQEYRKLRKEVKVIEKAIEKFLQNAVDSVSEKDFVLVNL